MDKTSAADLGRRLNDLAEIMDRKPLTEKAVLGWFDTLREFDTGVIFGVLKGWQKTHGKFPNPAEVWKSCNDFSGEVRERQQLADKVALERTYRDIKPTDEGRHKLRQILEILKRPKMTPLEHWRKVMRTEGLPQISYDFARAFLAKRDVVDEPPPREPGEDREDEHERTETA